MIRSAITHLASHLNQFLKRNYDLNEDIVVLANLLEQDGTLSADINNKLVVFLVNIQKDTLPYRPHNNRGQGMERAEQGYPPIFLNFHLMFAGHFTGKNYPESLKFLSETISFFQGHPVFDHQNSPDLDNRIDRLILDIENLNITDLSNLWGMISSKYLPSVLYKVRMVAFDSGNVRSMTHTLTEPRITVKQE